MTNALSVGCSFLLAASVTFSASGQNTLDLAALARDPTVSIHNRTATSLGDGTRRGIHLNAQQGDGLLWIPGVVLREGIIEIDVRGRNAPGQSFVGVAFDGKDDDTFEAIYVRPFNFRAEDSQRLAHAIQYISHPEYPWHRLRNEHPGRFESALDPAPDPNEWVHLQIVLEERRVYVYVNGSDKSTLAVERIGGQSGGRVGLFVGNNSEGDFSNLEFRSPG